MLVMVDVEWFFKYLSGVLVFIVFGWMFLVSVVYLEDVVELIGYLFDMRLLKEKFIDLDDDVEVEIDNLFKFEFIKVFW